MIFSGVFSLKTRIAIALTFLAISFFFIYIDYDKEIANYLVNFGLIGGMIAGLFYTFGISTPFAMAVIIDLMSVEKPFAITLLASMSAATLDCILFSVFKDILEKKAKFLKAKINKIVKKLNGLVPVFGFMVFGLPLPDELGLAMLGMTKIKIHVLWFIVFLSKFVMLSILWLSIGYFFN